RSFTSSNLMPVMTDSVSFLSLKSRALGSSRTHEMQRRRPRDGRLSGAVWQSLGSAIGPRTDTNAVARAVGERPVRRCMRLVDDAAARSDRRLETRLDALTRNRHVDVHRVAQCLSLVELLHPDRRSVSQGVHRIVVGHWSVAEDGAPKTDV